MIRECKNAGLVTLVFAYDQAGFRIEFRKMTGKSSGKILELIQSNNSITIPELANALGVSSRAIEQLKEENKIVRLGPAKGGHWEVVE